MPLGDIAVERKVRGTLGREIQNAHAADAVEREVADVVVAVKLADEIKALLLLNEPERRNNAALFLVERVDVLDFELRLPVEAFAHGVEDSRQNFGRQHRHGARNEGNLLEPGRHLLGRAALAKRRPRGIEERLERMHDGPGKLIAQVLFGQAKQEAFLRAQVRRRKVDRGGALLEAVGLRALVALDAEVLALGDVLQDALQLPAADVVARLFERGLDFRRGNPVVSRYALQNGNDEERAADVGVDSWHDEASEGWASFILRAAPRGACKRPMEATEAQGQIISQSISRESRSSGAEVA